MSYQVFVDARAITELDESYQWYNERSEGLGKKLMDAVNNRINEISQNPDRYPKKKKNYREVSIERFPFVIIYEILEKEKVIYVSYIFHTKRNPKLKYKR